MQDQQEASVVRINYQQAGVSCVVAILLIAIASQLLLYFSPSHLSMLDATVTSLSIVALYLLSQKMLESWLVWIVIDILYILLFKEQNTPYHAFMALFDATLCLIGFITWMKEYQHAILPMNSSLQVAPLP